MFKALIIASVVAMVATPTVPVEVDRGPTIEVIQGDVHMWLKPECAQVVIDSGYTDPYDVHRKLSITSEYLDACFPDRGKF